MRTIVRYVDGRAVWSDNQPASPQVHASRGGSMVVGESQRDRELRMQRASMKRKRETRYAEWSAHDALTSRCRHSGCVWIRVQEARRLVATTNLTRTQIGQMVGGHSHATVTYWLREYRDESL